MNERIRTIRTVKIGDVSRRSRLYLPTKTLHGLHRTRGGRRRKKPHGQCDSEPRAM